MDFQSTNNYSQLLFEKTIENFLVSSVNGSLSDKEKVKKILLDAFGRLKETCDGLPKGVDAKVVNWNYTVAKAIAKNNLGAMLDLWNRRDREINDAMLRALICLDQDIERDILGQFIAHAKISQTGGWLNDGKSELGSLLLTERKIPDMTTFYNKYVNNPVLPATTIPLASRVSQKPLKTCSPTQKEPQKFINKVESQPKHSIESIKKIIKNAIDKSDLSELLLLWEEINPTTNDNILRLLITCDKLDNKGMGRFIACAKISRTGGWMGDGTKPIGQLLKSKRCNKGLKEFYEDYVIPCQQEIPMSKKLSPSLIPKKTELLENPTQDLKCLILEAIDNNDLEKLLLLWKKRDSAINTNMLTLLISCKKSENSLIGQFIAHTTISQSGGWFRDGASEIGKLMVSTRCNTPEIPNLATFYEKCVIHHLHEQTSIGISIEHISHQTKEANLGNSTLKEQLSQQFSASRIDPSLQLSAPVKKAEMTVESLSVSRRISKWFVPAKLHPNHDPSLDFDCPCPDELINLNNVSLLKKLKDRDLSEQSLIDCCKRMDEIVKTGQLTPSNLASCLSLLGIHAENPIKKADLMVFFENNPQFYQNWENAIIPKMNSLNSTELSILLHALAKLQIKISDRFYHSWEKVACQKIDEFDSQQLSSSFYTHAQLERKPSQQFYGYWKEVVIKSMQERQFNPIDLTNSLYAHSELRWELDEDFFVTWGAAVDQSIDQFNSQNLASTAYGCVLLGKIPPIKILTKISELMSEAKITDERDLHAIYLSLQRLQQLKVSIPENLRDSHLFKQMLLQAKHKKTTTSNLQKSVVRDLKQIFPPKTQNTLVEEFWCDLVGSRVDGYMVHNGIKLFIEVDGPSHFIGDSDEYKLKNLLRNALLTNAPTNKVLRIPFFEWEKLGSSQLEKNKFLKIKLKECGVIL